jgi:hypothetical protein
LRDLAKVRDLMMTLKPALNLKDELDARVRGEYERMWASAQQPGGSQADRDLE